MKRLKVYQGEDQKIELAATDDHGAALSNLQNDANEVRVGLYVDQRLYVRYALSPPNAQFQALTLNTDKVELTLRAEDSATLPPGTLTAQLRAELSDNSYTNNTRTHVQHFFLGEVLASSVHNL